MPQTQTDPYSAYGGSVVPQTADDPYKQYGGAYVSNGPVTHMTDPQGKLAIVPQNQAGSYLKRGYKVGPPEQQPKPNTRFTGIAQVGDTVMDVAKEAPAFAGDLLSGLKHLAFYEPAKGETPANSGPEIQMARTMANTGSQAIEQFKKRQPVRGTVSALAAINPFAAGPVGETNTLEQQGQGDKATARGILNAGLLASGTGPGRAAIRDTARASVDALADTGAATLTDIGHEAITQRITRAPLKSLTPEELLTRTLTPDKSPQTVIGMHGATLTAVPRIQQAATNMGLTISTASDALEAIKQAKSEVLIENQNLLRPGQTLADMSPTQRAKMNVDLRSLDEVETQISSQQAAEAAKAAKAKNAGPLATRVENLKKVFVTGPSKVALGHVAAEAVPMGGTFARAAMHAAGVTSGFSDIASGIKGLRSGTTAAGLDAAIEKVFSGTAPDLTDITAQRALEGAQAAPAEDPFFNPQNGPIDRSVTPQQPKPRTPIWQNRGIQPRAPLGPDPYTAYGGKAIEAAPQSEAAIPQARAEQARPSSLSGSSVEFGQHPESIARQALTHLSVKQIREAARQVGVEVTPADTHSTLIPKILDSLNEDELQAFSEHVQGLRGTKPASYQEPPQATPSAEQNLAPALQQSIYEANARKGRPVPPVSGGRTAAVAEPSMFEGGVPPERRLAGRDPNSPTNVRLSFLRRELLDEADPTKKAEIQQAIDRELAIQRGERFNVPSQREVENLPGPGENPRLVNPAEHWKPKPSAAQGTVPAKQLEAGQTGFVNPNEISLQPQRFQYKQNVNERGVTNQFVGQKFNEDLMGVIHAFKDPETGELIAVNGHHRVDLAQNSQAPRIRVHALETTNPENARALGALQNIAEGQGTATDAAKFFRDTKISPNDLQRIGVSLSASKVSDGLALSKLDQSIFDKVATGRISEGRGVAIGKATEDAAQQEAIIKLIDRAERNGKNVTEGTVAELARFVAKSENRTIQQGGLFGANNEIHSTALQKAEVSDFVKKQIAQEKRVFGSVSKESTAQRLGQVKEQTIQAGENAKMSQAASQALEVYDKLSGTAGPVDGILNLAANRLANGETPSKVKSEAYDAIRKAIQTVISP